MNLQITSNNIVTKKNDDEFLQKNSTKLSIYSYELSSQSDDIIIFLIENIFKLYGKIYHSQFDESIISIDMFDLEKAKSVQKALRKLKIQSMIVKQAKKNLTIILMIEKSSVENFVQKLVSNNYSKQQKAPYKLSENEFDWEG